MVLTIDIGNTNIVIGCGKGEQWLFVERISTQRNTTVLEYAMAFKTVLDLYNIDPSDIEGGIISSVVPSITNIVKQSAEKVIGSHVMVVGPGIKTGLSIVIDNPAQLGSDLVVDAVAGIHYYNLPLVVCDFGTATTMSIIDENKCYLGGMIMPGVNTSLDALTMKAAQLMKIALEPPKKFIGKNTIDCMKSGIIYGTAESIDGMIDRVEKALGKKVSVVATGGVASSIVPYCRHEIVLDDELLLKGLNIIYEKNK